MKSARPLGKTTLILGLVLTLLGTVLLFWTQNFIDGLLRWWPSAFTVAGLYFLFKYFMRHAKPKFLLLGLLLFLTGTFILLLNTVLHPWMTLRELWPVFMGIAGSSLIPYGLHFRRKIRVSLIVPGIFLLIFMMAFLLFSLSVVKTSFLEFVIGWWPLLIVLMGLTLILSYYMRNWDRNGDKEPESKA